MNPYTKHSGLVAPLDRINVDTDQMVPKQFLTRVTREGYGKVLFYDWRYLEGEKPNPGFVLNLPRYRGASILLTRANFGCGSSREHAAWGTAQYGFRAVVGPSFGDIYYNNCFKNGVLPVRLPEKAIDELFRRTESNEGYTLSADLVEQTVSDEMGFQTSFEIDPDRKERLLNGLDDIGLTLQVEDKIAAYEEANPKSATMYESVDIIAPGIKDRAAS